LQPAYVRPDAPLPRTFPAGDAYRTASVDASPTHRAAPDLGWREVLPDPRLQELVELALQHNRDLRVAVLNVAQAEAQYRGQRSILLPQVGADAQNTSGRSLSGTTGLPTTSRSDSLDVSLSWELDFFGRLASLSDAARDQYLATAYARQAAEILLVSQVADQYLAMLADDEQLAVTRSTLDTARESFRIVKLQFDTGTASELDLRLAQTVVDQAQANQAAQVRLRAQAENALVLLVGQPLPANGHAPTSLFTQAIVADIPEGLPSDLLTRRPDVLQAEAALKAENANIGAARAAFFPQISLTAALGTASPMLGGLFGGGSGIWSFAPAAAASIFDGSARRADLDLARVQKDIGIAQYQKTIQTAFREVADGLAGRGTYDDQLAALRRFRDAQQSRLALADMRYRNGADSYLNVLTAQTDLYASRQALVTAQLEQLTNRVDLYRALGGGWIAQTGDAPRDASLDSLGQARSIRKDPL
jgi:multidrug efflux system outer membrane protein